MLKNLLLVSGLFLFSTSSYAATLITDESGQLTGATDVYVEGETYDVTFKDGSCIEIFDGCDQNTDFTFTSESSAAAASEALLNTVFINISTADFDRSPNLTLGCSDESHCAISTLFYTYECINCYVGFAAVNINEDGTDYPTPYDHTIVNLFTYEYGDTTTMPDQTYAVWSLSPVPVPAAAWLFGSALIGLAGIKRKK